ncbi:predicted protein [Nematostella vectensis]|uniref:Cholesterol 24-hydroxylase n=1 Tax=Nematostella vectensis TaxID=45351 RepID=A7SVN8_NEMVE|nr:cholesterol 24-hydroxylase [Nematostella vectensis]EDO32230.1 predicted protein [Nematostella vectensis]|eukprot:XP_001624330.1 predicted protein [Nematostella vectensis]
MIPFIEEYVSLQAFAIISLGLLSTPLTGFLAYCLYLFYVHCQYAHIPGPKRDSFFAGNVPSIQYEINVKKRGICELWSEWYNQFGGAHIFWVYHVPVLVLGHPDDVKKVLVTWNLPKASRLYKTISYCYGERFAGEGVLTELDHEVWKRKRALLNHAFHRKYLRNLMQAFNESSNEFLKRIGSLADGKTEVRMADEFAKVTLDVIGKVGFNIDVNSIGDENSPFPSAITTALDGLQKGMRNPFWKFKFWTFSYQEKVKSAIRFLRKFGQSVIMERNTAIIEGLESPKDILAHILQMGKENADYTLENMTDDFITFFVAGQETTSNQLSFTLMEILGDSSIENKICNEVDDVLGSRQYVEYQDLGKLEYVGMTLKEGLRLHPPITGTQRILPFRETLGGYNIPANTPVSVVYQITHCLEEFWENPLVFDPERFSSKNKSAISTTSFLPFCTGPRTCIGKTLAEFEAKLLLARLLQEFKLKLVPGQTKQILEQLTVRPRDGVICTITRR